MSVEGNGDFGEKIQTGMVEVAVGALRVANKGGRLEGIAEKALDFAGMVFDATESPKAPFRGAFRDRHVS